MNNEFITRKEFESLKAELGLGDLPCPFCAQCGVEVREVRTDGNPPVMFCAECTNCKARGPVLPYREDVIPTWNNRSKKEVK